MTKPTPHWSGMRWRKLGPAQANAICAAYKAGVRVEALAAEYGVHKRSIYRYLKRGGETKEVVVFGHRATFVQGEDGEPVRMTAWYAA